MVFNLTKTQVEKYIGKCQEVKNCPPAISNNSAVTFSKFIQLAQWKSVRPTGHYRRISENDIKEASKIAFTTHDEYVRIHVLQSLQGIGWPIASVILHFAFLPYSKNKQDYGYPIADEWAMRAIGVSTKYSFEKWMKYVKFCRSKAKQYNISMRDLDKALWAYGKFGLINSNEAVDK